MRATATMQELRRLPREQAGEGKEAKQMAADFVDLRPRTRGVISKRQKQATDDTSDEVYRHATPDS